MTSPPRVLLRRRAQVDLEEHAEYIALDRPMAAARFLEAVEKNLNELAELPLQGSPRRFASSTLKNVRSWAVSGFGNFLIFYRPTARGIEVVRVLHSARDLGRILGPER
jgi:toxin ParE1/3/4